MIARYEWYTRVNTAGHNAYRRGEPFWANPHPRYSAKWTAWYDGYLAAGGLL